MKKALLLGAGFSYDLGMPLANGLTQDFFHFFNPARMKKYFDLWKTADPFGPGRPIDTKAMDDIYELYQVYRNNPQSNYEEFLKEIQKQHKELGRTQPYLDCLHFVFGKYFDAIFQMLWMNQVTNLQLYVANKKFYKFLTNFLSDNELWILSLNHDLFIEFLCFDYNIPLSFGSLSHIDFPQSNHNLKDYITFGRISRQDMRLGKMGFICGNRGINLIKLHGAINEFFYDDDKYVLHIGQTENETPISYLQKTNKVSTPI